jgi:hypothetical protein
MSLMVTSELLDKARQGALTPEEFVNCIRDSLPKAWAILSDLANRVMGGEVFAEHAPITMDDDTRGQLLRILAGTALREAVEAHFGLRFFFQNCHKAGGCRPEHVDSPQCKAFISPMSQLLNQTPELRNC